MGPGAMKILVFNNQRGVQRPAVGFLCSRAVEQSILYQSPGARQRDERAGVTAGVNRFFVSAKQRCIVDLGKMSFWKEEKGTKISLFPFPMSPKKGKEPTKMTKNT